MSEDTLVGDGGSGDLTAFHTEHPTTPTIGIIQQRALPIDSNGRGSSHERQRVMVARGINEGGEDRKVVGSEPKA